VDAELWGITGLATVLNDQQGLPLNGQAINCLRSFPGRGFVVWGARTLAGSDALRSEYKYVPVRRTALYIEESLSRGLHWAAVEPNAEPLWAAIRTSANAFLHGLWRQGAFQGRTPLHAYFVKCDATTTTPSDVSAGVVNLLVGFAPLKPVEFVVLRIQQLAGHGPT
jgi:phage tail sheath protein FI